MKNQRFLHQPYQEGKDKVKFEEFKRKNQSTQPLLQVKKVSKFFGGLVAVNEVNLDVYPEEIVSIIGPNGAGKTTLFNVIAGVLRPTKGEIWFEERELSKLPTWQISQLGIGTTFQHFRLFNSIPGFHNAMVGTWKHGKVGFIECGLRLPRVKEEDRTLATQLLRPLAILGLLDKRLSPPPSTMTLKEQRFLTIGRALASNPKLLLLDEPAAALTYDEIKELIYHLLHYRQQGITILLIDHRMELVMNISDRIVVLNYGRKIADDTPDNIRGNKEVLASYLGEGMD